MKTTLIVAACIATAAGSAVGQTAAKQSTAAGLGKVEPGSSSELNIRAYIELLRTDVKKSKAQIMNAVMQLDTDEAARFWPIYQDFEAEYTKLGDRVIAIVKTYAENYVGMTDAAAAELGSQVLSVEQQRNVLKKKYFERLKDSLGGITATRFLQVENQLERLVDLQIAAELPVIRER